MIRRKEIEAVQRTQKYNASCVSNSGSNRANKRVKTHSNKPVRRMLRKDTAAETIGE
jgi:hypothetical protein